jgi:hypothetical protein
MPSPQVAAFFETIQPWRKAYKDVRVSYLAAKLGQQFTLLQARADHVVNDVPLEIPRFEADRVVGGQYLLSVSNLESSWFVDEASAGRLHTPNGIINVQGGTGPNFVTELSRLHPDGLANRKRTTVLTINAGLAPQGQRREEFDWELRSALIPYDGLQDLAGALGLNAAQLDRAFFVVSAIHAAELDLSSTVAGTVARPGCFVAHGLDPEDVMLKYRVVQQNKTIERATIAGIDMKWESREKAAYGVAEIAIPAGAVVQCFVGVNGHTHDHGWIVDPATFPNPMRTIFETYDQSLSTLSSTLFDKDRKGGGNTRDVEAAVGWLLWLLGFSTAHLGATKNLQDGPDLLATTPSKNVVVIECTTGMLKSDKLARLAERRTTLRKRLDGSGHTFARIVTAIVTTLTRDEVEADLDQAERMSILVVTREDLEQGLARTLTTQDPEKSFREAEEVIKVALERRINGDAR